MKEKKFNEICGISTCYVILSRLVSVIESETEDWSVLFVESNKVAALRTLAKFESQSLSDYAGKSFHMEYKIVETDLYK